MGSPEIETGFEFYLRFAKPLVLNLNKHDEKALAAAWIQKLRDENVGSESLRTDYLKLLLFVLQRKQLIGPFLENPNQCTELKPLPSTNLHDVAKELLELEEEYHKQKVKKGKAGPYGDFPPYSTEYSANLLEYSAAQNIPNFGVHAYYAISIEPLPLWHKSEKAVFSRSLADALTKSRQPPSRSPLLKTFESPPKSLSLKDIEAFSPLGKSKESTEKRSPKLTKKEREALLPPVIEPRKEGEEIRSPTWGSNLIGVTEPSTSNWPFKKYTRENKNLLFDESQPSLLELNNLSPVTSAERKSLHKDIFPSKKSPKERGDESLPCYKISDINITYLSAEQQPSLLAADSPIHLTSAEESLRRKWAEKAARKEFEGSLFSYPNLSAEQEPSLFAADSPIPLTSAEERLRRKWAEKAARKEFEGSLFSYPDLSAEQEPSLFVADSPIPLTSAEERLRRKWAEKAAMGEFEDSLFLHHNTKTSEKKTGSKEIQVLYGHPSPKRSPRRKSPQKNPRIALKYSETIDDTLPSMTKKETSVIYDVSPNKKSGNLDEATSKEPELEEESSHKETEIQFLKSSTPVSAKKKSPQIKEKSMLSIILPDSCLDLLTEEISPRYLKEPTPPKKEDSPNKDLENSLFTRNLDQSLFLINETQPSYLEAQSPSNIDVEEREQLVSKYKRHPKESSLSYSEETEFFNKMVEEISKSIFSAKEDKPMEWTEELTPTKISKITRRSPDTQEKIVMVKATSTPSKSQTMTGDSSVPSLPYVTPPLVAKFDELQKTLDKFDQRIEEMEKDYDKDMALCGEPKSEDEKEAKLQSPDISPEDKQQTVLKPPQLGIPQQTSTPFEKPLDRIEVESEKIIRIIEEKPKTNTTKIPQAPRKIPRYSGIPNKRQYRKPPGPVSQDASNVSEVSDYYEEYIKYYKNRRSDVPDTPPMFSKYQRKRDHRQYSPSEFDLTEDVQWQPAENYFKTKAEMSPRESTRGSNLRKLIRMDDLRKKLIFDESTPELISLEDDDFNTMSTAERSPVVTQENVKQIERKVDTDLQILKATIPAEGGIPLTTPQPTLSPKRISQPLVDYNQQIYLETPPQLSPQYLTLEKDQIEYLDYEEIPIDLEYSPPTLSPTSTFPFLKNVAPNELNFFEAELPPEDFLFSSEEEQTTPQMRIILSPSTPKSPTMTHIKKLVGSPQLENIYKHPLNIEDLPVIYPNDLMGEEGLYPDWSSISPTELDKSIPKIGLHSPLLSSTKYIELFSPKRAPRKRLHVTPYRPSMWADTSIPHVLSTNIGLLSEEPPEFLNFSPTTSMSTNGLQYSPRLNTQRLTVLDNEELKPYSSPPYLSPEIPPFAELIKKSNLDLLDNEVLELYASPPRLSPIATDLSAYKVLSATPKRNIRPFVGDRKLKFGRKIEWTSPSSTSSIHKSINTSPISPTGTPETGLEFMSRVMSTPDVSYSSPSFTRLVVGKTGKTMTIERKSRKSKLYKIKDYENVEDEEGFEFINRVSAEPASPWELSRSSRKIIKSPQQTAYLEHPMLVLNEEFPEQYPENLMGDPFHIDWSVSYTKLDESFMAPDLQPPLEPYNLQMPWLSPARKITRKNFQPLMLPNAGESVNVRPYIRNLVASELPPESLEFSPPQLSPETDISSLKTYVPVRRNLGPINVPKSFLNLKSPDRKTLIARPASLQDLDRLSRMPFNIKTSQLDDEMLENYESPPHLSPSTLREIYSSKVNYAPKITHISQREKIDYLDDENLELYTSPPQLSASATRDRIPTPTSIEHPVRRERPTLLDGENLLLFESPSTTRPSTPNRKIRSNRRLKSGERIEWSSPKSPTKRILSYLKPPSPMSPTGPQETGIEFMLRLLETPDASYNSPKHKIIRVGKTSGKTVTLKRKSHKPKLHIISEYEDFEDEDLPPEKYPENLMGEPYFLDWSPSSIALDESFLEDHLQPPLEPYKLHMPWLSPARTVTRQDFEPLILPNVGETVTLRPQERDVLSFELPPPGYDFSPPPLSPRALVFSQTAEQKSPTILTSTRQHQIDHSAGFIPNVTYNVDRNAANLLDSEELDFYADSPQITPPRQPISTKQVKRSPNLAEITDQEAMLYLDDVSPELYETPPDIQLTPLRTRRRNLKSGRRIMWTSPKTSAKAISPTEMLKPLSPMSPTSPQETGIEFMLRLLETPDASYNSPKHKVIRVGKTSGKTVTLKRKSHKPKLHIISEYEDFEDEDLPPEKYPENLMGEPYFLDWSPSSIALDESFLEDHLQPPLEPYKLHMPWLSPARTVTRQDFEPLILPNVGETVTLRPQERDVLSFELPPPGYDFSPSPLSPRALVFSQTAEQKSPTILTSTRQHQIDHSAGFIPNVTYNVDRNAANLLDSEELDFYAGYPHITPPRQSISTKQVKRSPNFAEITDQKAMLYLDDVSPEIYETSPDIQLTPLRTRRSNLKSGRRIMWTSPKTSEKAISPTEILKPLSPMSPTGPHETGIEFMLRLMETPDASYNSPKHKVIRVGRTSGKTINLERKSHKPQLHIISEYEDFEDEDLPPEKYPENLMGEPYFLDWSVSSIELDKPFSEDHLQPPLEPRKLHMPWLSPARTVTRQDFEPLILPNVGERVNIKPSERDVLSYELPPDDLDYSPPYYSPSTIFPEERRLFERGTSAISQRRDRSRPNVEQIQEYFDDLQLLDDENATLYYTPPNLDEFDYEPFQQYTNRMFEGVTNEDIWMDEELPPEDFYNLSISKDTITPSDLSQQLREHKYTEHPYDTDKELLMPYVRIKNKNVQLRRAQVPKVSPIQDMEEFELSPITSMISKSHSSGRNKSEKSVSFKDSVGYDYPQRLPFADMDQPEILDTSLINESLDKSYIEEEKAGFKWMNDI